MSDEFIEDGRPDVDPFDPESETLTAEDRVKRIDAAQAEIVKFLLRRKEAYARVFANADTGDVRMVLDDLRMFTRGETSAWSSDAREHALLTGRQEVYIRIMDHTRMDLDTLLAKYNPQQRT